MFTPKVATCCLGGYDLPRLFLPNGGAAMNQPDLRKFAWLADAPLLIDGPQVERLYDTAVRLMYVESLAR